MNLITRTRLAFVAMLILTQAILHAQAPTWAWAKTSVNGNGSSQLGGFDYSGSVITTDPPGNSYVVGIYSNSVTLGSFTVSALYGGIFVAKYDSAGACLWLKQFGSNDGDLD